MDSFIMVPMAVGVIVTVIVIVVRAGSSPSALDTVILEVGNSLGIKYRGGGMLSQSVASGVVDGFKVTIRPYSDPQKRSGFTNLIRIYIAHALNTGGLLKVTLEGDELFAAVEKLLKGEDIQVGDGAFDSRMLIKGTSPCHAAALMNERVRGKILALVGRTRGLNLTSNWFEIVLDFDRRTKEEIVSIAQDALEVSRDMSRTDDVRSRLMENIRSDSMPGVRAACIRHLTAHFPQDIETTALLKGALNDDSCSVRIAAAMHLGYDGLDALTNMLEDKGALDEPDILRIVRYIGEHRFSEGIPALKHIFARDISVPVQVAALGAFATLGDTGLNGFLLEQLDLKSGAVRDGVISALATCGTVEAVEPLLKLAKSSINPFFRSEVQKAVASIQSRLGGADAGWLSVTAVEGTDGALSLSDAAGEGALSREKKDKD